ncbi:hypothetical protein GIB67_011615 [Kingdonia uniflora]|uniref:Rab3GAP catalytic subunit conserved domain-containing protein n=1 Tax=Kingdonia uniflora TaxID=39325 RepID=A0A7J7NMI1_9MAGN|nr:hypothetical protein GIB67_011615 [Kingdonia uniflora]
MPELANDALSLEEELIIKMQSPSSSLVSKAKTAFHSAALKAEKVLIDFKTTDHHYHQSDSEGQQSTSKKSPELDLKSETIDVECEHELKYTRWKSAALGRKQDWQDRLNKIRRIKSTEEREKSPCSTDFDEYLDQMDLGTCVALKVTSEFHFSLSNRLEIFLKREWGWAKESAHNLHHLRLGNMGPERETSAEKEKSNASNADYIPPTSVIKQLAIAVESSKKFKVMKDLLVSVRDSSPARERASLSFSAMKSLVLRDKEDKLTSELSYDDEILSLSHSLFKPEGKFPRRSGSGSASSSFPRDIHGAPLESFVVELSEIFGNFKTLRKMALFWCRVVAELRRLWYEGQPVPLVPQDGNPDLHSCLLYQQLQVINCCISRKRRRIIASDTLDSIMKEAGPNTEELHVSPGIVPSSSVLYARINTGELVLRLGAHHLSENLTMLETGEPIYSPVTQEGPVLTEDLIRETEEFILRTGSVGVGCSQLLSDMQAFKAANPGCILEDFVRWHSPPDWTETYTGNEAKDSHEFGDPTSRRGQLSSRMQKEGNLWRELWETAKPLPAVKQTPLFDEDLAVEGILNFLEKITPFELFKQLFVSLLGAGFVIAESVLSTSSNLSKLFYECKDYAIATCQGGTLGENIDDLCQVYETIEAILVHPEDGLKIMKQSEETTAVDEPKHRFKKLTLNFVGKERPFFRNPASKYPRDPEENPTRLMFPNLTSPFSKKPPKPTDNLSSCIEDNDWTIV